MKIHQKLFASVIILSTLMVSQGAFAEGCLKGAAVGGVAGHFLGKHPILGAGAGCIVGQHIAKKNKEKEIQAQSSANQATSSSTQKTTPAYLTPVK